MKLSTPDDDPNQPVRDDTDSTPRESASRMVEVPYSDGETDEVPITRAVELNREMLMHPDDFGLARDDAVDALFQMIESVREERDDLQARVAHLEATIEMLCAESEILNGECPDCGGVLEPRGGGFSGRRRVECSECERELTPNGTVR